MPARSAGPKAVRPVTTVRDPRRERNSPTPASRVPVPADRGSSWNVVWKRSPAGTGSSMRSCTNVGAAVIHRVIFDSRHQPLEAEAAVGVGLRVNRPGAHPGLDLAPRPPAAGCPRPAGAPPWSCRRSRRSVRPGRHPGPPWPPGWPAARRGWAAGRRRPRRARDFFSRRGPATRSDGEGPAAPRRPAPRRTPRRSAARPDRAGRRHPAAGRRRPGAAAATPPPAG